MGFLGIGLKLLPYIVSAVEAVERLIHTKGEEKEHAAVGMVHAILQAVESGLDRDLLNDEDVNRATRDVMRAVVSLHNVIKSKSV
jgi:hypothetical protein